MKTIWTSNGELDNLMNMSIEDKRQKLLDFGYDQEMVNGLETEQEVNDVLSEEPLIYDGAAMDFEEEIAPMLANQFFEGLILDEQFNLVDPAELLNFDSYSAELYEDDNGDLYWQTEGRKAFPILGFSDNPEGMITQLGELEILDSLHNLYPEHEDVDFLDRYYFEDFIPRDWNMLTNILTHAKNESKLGECAERDLTEAKAKNPIKLEAELEEIKDLAEEYGYEYLLQSPFVNYDNDPISIEYQYPEFARIVKSFFKEMGLDMEDLDLQWDSLDKHDWDTIIKVCDKLVTGKGVQFEKEYKTGYNSPLDDDEILANREEESLNEDVNIDKLKETIADEFYETYLMGIDDNYAQEAAAKWPQYDLDWCNVEGDNLMAQEVDEAKYNLAKTIVKSLFANAPQNESLVEGSQDNNKEIEDVIWDAISNAAYNLEVEKEIHLDKEVFRNIVNKVIDRFMVDDEIDESLNEAKDPTVFEIDGLDIYMGRDWNGHNDNDQATIGSINKDGFIELRNPDEWSDEERKKILSDLSCRANIRWYGKNFVKGFVDESLNEGLSHDAKKVIFDTFEYYDDGEGWDPSGYTVLFNDIVNNANDIVKKELLSKKQEVMSYIDKLATYEFDGPTYEFDALNYDTSLNEANDNDWPWGDPKTTLPKKKEPAEDTSLDNLID